MCDTRGLDHPRCFQFNLLSAKMLEQPSAFTEQYRHEVNLYFIKQSSLQALLSDIHATHHLDVFITCCCFCLRKSAFDALADDGIPPSSPPHPFSNTTR